MEAIILAGGFGTRLRAVVSDVPKPMAPIAGRPFLEVLLDDLERNGVNRVVLAVGYKRESIISHFGRTYKSIALEYSVEDTPLGTGGAIKKALARCHDDDVLIVNGDTFFDVDLGKMMTTHKGCGAPITMAIKEMTDFSRYGTIEVSDKYVTGMAEKKPCKKGYINGGIYCVRRHLLDDDARGTFSFESDFLEKAVGSMKIRAFISDGYFIDIGVPEDYARAQTELSEFENISSICEGIL